MRAVALLAVLVWPLAASAITDLEMEEEAAELLATPPPRAEETTATRTWAVLPQVSFGPDTGPVGGVKLDDRDLAGSGTTLDLDATYALERQQRLVLTVGWPHLGDDRFLAFFRARYDRDPQFDFFGLGNNDVGPDPVSTHLRERTLGDAAVGWRPWPRLALSAHAGIHHVHIGHGDRLDADTPFTVDRFPDLPGIRGGNVVPIGLSLVWTTRDSPVVPTRGWRALLKVEHTNRSLGSAFEFTRYVGDLGYVRSFGRHTLGARLDGAVIEGPHDGVPFWELEELGGDDTLRGFFPARFRGRSRALLNLEYRGRMTEFDFFRLWHVQLDGVLFGEAGRVFITTHELRDQFRLTGDVVSRVVQSLQYSYGGGLRVALSQALVARIDVGFSEEEKGLVYLAFGQTF